SGTLAPRICKLQAAVWLADNVIGTIEALVVPAVGQDGIRAVRFQTGHPAVDHLADDDPSLGVEGHTVGFTAVLSDDFRGTPRHQFDDLAATDVDEQQVAVGMP